MNKIKGVAKVVLTRGFGNNISQYVIGRLASEIQETCLSLQYPANYYAINSLKKLGIYSPPIEFNKSLDVSYVNDGNVASALTPMAKTNFHIEGYFEDYKLFSPHLEKIRSWFPMPAKKNTKDLILHLRLGDRLVYKNHYGTNMLFSAEEYKKVFKEFEFEKLHISTDIDSWTHKSKKDIDGMKFHIGVAKGVRIDSQIAADYFNSLVDGFSDMEPIIHNSGNIDLLDDFNLIRGFKNILGGYSTLFWWAAVLSEAKKVGVYGPWRPAKGKRNKNLGQTDYEGWFSWGNDLPGV